MTSKSPQQVDTRIVKTRYKNYELLARHWNGKYRGRVWKNAEKMADYEGESIDLVLDALMQIVDSIREKHFATQVSQPFSDEHYCEAWSAVLPNCSDEVKSTLFLHSRSANSTTAIGQLVKAGNYESVNQLMSDYQVLERSLQDELLLDTQSAEQSLDKFVIGDTPQDEMPSMLNRLTMQPIWSASLKQAKKSLKLASKD